MASHDGISARQIAVLAPDGARPGWYPEDGAHPVPVTLDATRLERDFTPDLGAATAAFIDGGVEAPLSLARRIHRLAPGVQVAIVAPEEAHERLRQAKLFTPGIGEVWIVLPDDVTDELLERAASIGRTRRRHGARSGRVAREVATLVAADGKRPFLADQYLATLLELLPDPVMAIDDAGAVVFTNPPAASVLGAERSESLSAEEVRARLRPVDPRAWEAILERAWVEPVREEMELGAPDERRVYHVAAGPVAGERPMRAVLLHDVTESVEAQEALEHQSVRLEEYGAELEHQNRELEAQAEELQMQAEELTSTAEELRSVMKHRSRFYASMSHELRTPINAIVGYTALLRDQVYGSVPPEQQEALERITRAAGHLLDLVNDVLDLSKVEAGKIEVRPEPLDVSELVRDLEATMRPLADENDVALTFSIDQSCAGEFSTDPRRLRQILMNLLSNAIRYAVGAPVEVRCSVEADRLCAEVADKGPGIPASKIEEIFDEFVQLDDEGKGGTGLGLPISRGLARSLGGELTVESEEGEGSVFRVEVPWLPSQSEKDGAA